jgi:hypothetical protein
MASIILDPRTGARVALTEIRTRAEQKARQWVLRELDRAVTGPERPAKNVSNFGSSDSAHGQL